MATASRSMLLDLDAAVWSPRAAAIFGLDPGSLPRLVDCAGPLGSTSAFGPELALTGLCVDQQAALIGEGCLQPGSAKCTYGTGAFLLVAGDPHPAARAAGCRPRSPGRWASSAPTASTGRSTPPVPPSTGWSDSASSQAPVELDERASGADPSSEVLFVPSLAGLGAPQWEPRAAASFEAMTLSTGPASWCGRCSRGSPPRWRSWSGRRRWTSAAAW